MKLKNKIKVSIIVPYHNEEKNIIKTLYSIQNQTYQNFEVLLINSSSKDKTCKLVDSFISKNKLKNFNNLSENTIFPSDSKNLGIKKSKNDYLAFMDCGLKFSKNWLSDQIMFMGKHRIDFSLGMLSTNAKNDFDAAVISQTWGLNKIISVIPGSVIKKKIFKNFGIFEVSRAGYDKLWVQNLKKNRKIFKNLNAIVKYEHNIHSDNFKDLYKKIYLYSYFSSKFFIKKLFIYFIGLLFFAYLAFLFNIFVPIFIYFFLRIIFPFFKSNFSIKLLNPKIFIRLLPVAMIIDISRLFGYFRRVFNFFF
tara:strand:- start:765 stop:1685 length:921 start_codon:yes stop_codon:yes gene_type:complete